MPTTVVPKGLAWLADQVAGQDVTLSVHTALPTDDLSAGELATGGGRAYARKVEPAASFTAAGDSATAQNPAVINLFTPNATDVGAGAQPTATYIGIRIGGNPYGYAELAAPIGLIAGVPFEIAANTLDFTFRARVT